MVNPWVSKQILPFLAFFGALWRYLALFSVAGVTAGALQQVDD
jgi:hypothetical protein